MIKTFNDWHRLKFLTNARLLRPRFFAEAQIWWCIVGENIGHEIDGKQEKFLRPVLILKKAGGESFIGIPTTSKDRSDKVYYYNISIGNFKTTLLFSQIRAWDACRLTRRIVDVPEDMFRDIKAKLNAYLGLA